MEIRNRSERLQALTDELVDGCDRFAHIKGSRCRICVLESDCAKTSKGRTVFAECEKVPAKYLWAVPCDFTITVFTPNVERFDEEQLRVLMHHELLHVGIELDGNEEIYNVVPHDVEDFKEVIERWGMDWHSQRG